MRIVGTIPIEEEREAGIGGVIRCEMGPDLIAFRAEEWRFMRLSRILGAAKAFAATRLDRAVAEGLLEAILSFADYKGDFLVIWKSADLRQRYARFVDEALALEDEEEAEHEDARQGTA